MQRTDTALPADVLTTAHAELGELLNALQAVRDGDFSVRLPGHWTGLEGKIADTFNEIVASNERMASELERVGTVVGKRGKTRQRVKFGRVSGAWGEMEGSVNTLIDDLLWPTTEVTRVLAAVAKGDLLQTVRLDVDGRPLEGEFLRSATIVNTMIEQLGVFTSEVTRVAREVGTDGKLGGQAEVRNVSGVWKDLTDSVNSMARRSPSTFAARFCSSRKPSTRWSTSCDRSRRKSRASRRRSAPKDVSAGRPSCPASPAPGRTSPTRSTRWRAT
jgi:methyl-accepting chemotaxis protein